MKNLYLFYILKNKCFLNLKINLTILILMTNNKSNIKKLISPSLTNKNLNPLIHSSNNHYKI
jgi:hypothetical protein